MRELFFKEAVKKYGASKKCDLTFEMRVCDVTDESGKPLAVLGQIKTNCGYDAFLQLKEGYSATVKKYGEIAMFELTQVNE